MPIFHRNKKPQSTRPSDGLFGRLPTLVIPADQKAYEAEWGAFIEDAISDEDAMKARVRSYE
jgi:hypothetical protein